MPEHFTKQEGEYDPMNPRSKNPWAEMGIGEWSCYLRLYGAVDLDSIYHPKLREL